MKIPVSIGAIGKMLAYGFGPDVLKGFIPAYLGRISLGSCVEYINEDKDLLASISEEDWIVLRKVAQAAKIELSYKTVMAQLENSRSDVWSIIYSTPGGPEWLEKQIQNCRGKLGIS